jgi:hypothetical protein
MSQIVLTGDVHHMSMRTRDQLYLSGISEVDAAAKCADIAAASEVRLTLFLTGRCALEEPAAVRALAARENVEIGGHNYWAFRPRWLYNGLFRRILRRPNGPSWFERYEIRRTREILRGVGAEIVSWRDHGYRHGRRTYEILSQEGLINVSDDVDPEALGPRRIGGILSVPINVLPDHEHVRHAEVREACVREPSGWQSRFPGALYDADEWGGVALQQAEALLERGGLPTLLAHPACMEIADGMATFRRLCVELAKLGEVVTMSETTERTST